MRTLPGRSTVAATFLIASALLVPASPRTALAQESDKITEMARAKFIEGAEAFNAKRYAEARELFLQAYAMKRHPAVLLNLGLSEIKAGDPETGGAHLQQFLREHDQATPQQKQSARDGIAEAKKTTGYVILIVDTDGATVFVDGNEIGKSPLTDPVFVKAGEHEVEARSGGRRVRIKVDAKPGAMTSAQVNLKTGATEAAPPERKEKEKEKEKEKPDSGDDTRSGNEDLNRWSNNDLPPNEEGPYSGDSSTFGSAAAAGSDAGASPASNRLGFFSWIKKKPAAIATLGIGGGLGLIGTIAFGAAAGSANGAASDVTAVILAETRNPSDPSGVLPAGYYDAGGNPIPCGKLDEPTSAHPYYRGACDQLRSNLDAYDTDIALMATSLVVMSLSVGGTFVWYYLDTSKSAASPAAGPPQAFVTLAPVVTGDQKGLSLIGTF
ncbi:MAG: PEGA domain-containing protein [Deltaproteobacteria bacterium]|nr:PEGA domain-containing protein [Deltaproteobacteria bacterium]